MTRIRKTKIQKIEESDYIDKDTLVPTGSTILNLALSDHIEGGWQLGKIENLIGDSSSGKTGLALTTLAEVCKLERFDDHLIIYDDVEQANEFNIKKLFGKKTKRRIQPPRYDENKDPLYSDTIEDFFYGILTFLEAKKPIIYILDSLDALDAEEDQKKVKEQKTAYNKSKKTKGTFGAAKPKAMSRLLKNLKKKIKVSNSLLIIISQTRDNISPISFVKKIRSGGKALKFYCLHECWMALGKPYKKQGIDYGVLSKIKVKKNKLTGKVREASFAIFNDYGIDDIGSCVDFLIENDHWDVYKQTITAKEFNIEATRTKIIDEIENKNLERKLKRICQKVWNQREEDIKINRKKKYQ